MANLLYRLSSTATTPTSTAVKNAPLTNLEIDANFKSLDDAVSSASTTLSNATSLATPNTIALRDASGNFAAVTINVATLNSTTLISTPTVQISGTTVIDSSRNISNVGNITTPTIVGGKETRIVMPADAINLAAGNYFTKTITTTTTLTVSNVPTAGTAVSFILDLTNGGSSTVNWWSGVKWAAGAAPSLTISGRDILGFFTHDGGTTWNGVMLGRGMA